MTVRRLLPAAALTLAACAPLSACDSPAPSTTTAATSPTPGSPGAMRTLLPSRLCAALTADAARELVPGARFTAQVGPDKGTAPDVCAYTSPDGSGSVSLTPATRPYAAELAAAYSLRADPAPAGMSGVRVDTVSGLGERAFRETAYQTQAHQNVTFTVWNAGARTWVLTYASTGEGPVAPGAVGDDEVVGVARTLAREADRCPILGVVVDCCPVSAGSPGPAVPALP
ncbi:hypothetical protein IAG44_03675 [Streptomyces roseirectus]|uniref:DUF3558 domain-containing protein n=1 Tax=Streptomyces roseirectus TaxID=2768066 RepID=A0A7H0I785_9ACTN|nr:hypothetical protein [Streptomyces roseirectus]QNP68651.1 hypothetical protein IAG44_03675 [Streptomyces roseirectus]